MLDDNAGLGFHGSPLKKKLSDALDDGTRCDEMPPDEQDATMAPEGVSHQPQHQEGETQVVDGEEATEKTTKKLSKPSLRKMLVVSHNIRKVRLNWCWIGGT